MASIFLMRGWDPIGEEYKHWTSPVYDPLGTSYVGPPAFGTLVGVTSIDAFLEPRVAGFSAFDPTFDPTQETVELTENSAQFSNEAELITTPPTSPTGAGGMEQPALSTEAHPSTTTESELRAAPASFQGGLSISASSLQQFEAI